MIKRYLRHATVEDSNDSIEHERIQKGIDKRDRRKEKRKDYDYLNSNNTNKLKDRKNPK